jgi:hypothetical protein
MLEMTLDAATFVDDTRRRFELPDSAGLRIWMDPDTAESTYHVGFTTKPSISDEVVEQWGARVFVAIELSEVLRGQMLDLDEAASPPRLYLRDQEDGGAA